MKTAELKFYGFIIFPALSGAGTHHRVTLRCVTRGSRDALVLFQHGRHTLLFKRNKSAARGLFPDRSEVIRSD